ncbi:MAG: hypothetical protein ABG776_21180, partial [Cyanobacteria bacterium J06555_13]
MANTDPDFAHDFENELPSDQTDRRTPGPETIGLEAVNPNGIARSVPSHNESFSLDYNPDPDLQADNAEIETYPLSRSQLRAAQPNGALNGTKVNGTQAATISSSNSKGNSSKSNNSKSVVQERYQRQPAINPIQVAKASISVVAIAGVIVVVVGFTLGSFWLTLAGSLVALIVSLRLMAPTLQEALSDLSQQQRALFVAIPGVLFGLIGLIYTSGISRPIARWGSGLRWDIISALGDFLGAIGQIFIAVLAVYVAWRQYIISRDLTVQQNLITQQQTIDSYFQGISELVLDDEGLLE